MLPNVREILEHLTGRSDVRSYLLTGNTRAGATAKLTHYDLIQFFPDGAFAEDAGARSSIASRALNLARQTGAVSDGRVFVIGDTPHDIECARAIDARTIAVATGGYSVDELKEHEPWRVFAELPPPQDFMRLHPGRRPGTGARRMKHGIRRFPAIWRASRLARRWYHAQIRRLSRLAQAARRSTAISGNRRATRRRAVRAC